MTQRLTKVPRVMASFISEIMGQSQAYRKIISFMMLYQYMHDNQLLGKEIEEITGQEIVDHIYQEKNLDTEEKQVLMDDLFDLSAMPSVLIDDERADADPLMTTCYDIEFLRIEGRTAGNIDESTTSLNNVAIMGDCIMAKYMKEPLLIPLEDILKMPHSNDGNKASNILIALRLTLLGPNVNTVKWEFQDLIDSEGPQQSDNEKSELWEIFVEYFEAGKIQKLIDYKLTYIPNKPKEFRYIDKVTIKKLWESQ